MDAAAEALTDMPPRQEDELDPVTLHNNALVNMTQQPTDGFEKLQYLLSTGTAPPVTFSNLIVLYLKYEYFSLAADTMAENQDLATGFSALSAAFSRPNYVRLESGRAIGDSI